MDVFRNRINVTLSCATVTNDFLVGANVGSEAFDARGIKRIILVFLNCTTESASCLTVVNCSSRDLGCVDIVYGVKNETSFSCCDGNGKAGKK